MRKLIFQLQINLLRQVAYLRAFGPRVTGVILTGTLEDGAAGLWWIKRMGGATIVQDPTEAEFADMPRSARTSAEPVEELGEGLPE
jgi:chemotaxis response regulator CheB